MMPQRLCILPLVALLAGFSGCSSTSQITTVDTLKVGLATAETLADVYVKLPLCGSPPCHTPEAVEQIAKADQVAFDAIQAASKGAASGQTVDLTAAQSALVAFQGLVTAYMPPPSKGAAP